MRIWKYQVSRQSITAEAVDSFRNSGRPEKAIQENPVHVRRHRLLAAMYTNCAATMTHQLRLSTSDAPRRPMPSWYTTSQPTTRWSTSVAAEV
ncbi:Os03g0570775 [Oryza sativa Japonica Group]|uniref:Os03g0570775 protein n=1 Tax=Oryza sativa subsp. japonica TaxID=39947 RepID=A0A0P0VZD8_ORYSJ|nr:hypothetical protein EE612_018528 [Oryza sativa]BAS84989.1 Os03g0570775 [Oryza sativa Japonica Group]